MDQEDYPSLELLHKLQTTFRYSNVTLIRRKVIETIKTLTDFKENKARIKIAYLTREQTIHETTQSSGQLSSCFIVCLLLVLLGFFAILAVYSTFSSIVQMVKYNRKKGVAPTNGNNNASRKWF
jgi:hypothetical protein